MVDETLKSRGSMFINESRSGKEPHFRGYVELNRAQVKKLIEMDKAGEEMKLQLGGWKNISDSGTKYIGLKVEAYRKPPERQQAPADDGWGDESDDDGFGDDLDKVPF